MIALFPVTLLDIVSSWLAAWPGALSFLEVLGTFILLNKGLSCINKLEQSLLCAIKDPAHNNACIMSPYLMPLTNI